MERSSSESAIGASLRDLLPDQDFRLHLGIGRGSVRDFFAHTAQHDHLMKQRAALLHELPSRHAGLLPEGEEVLDEAIAMAHAYGAIEDSAVAAFNDVQIPHERLMLLGTTWEPDYILLRRDAQNDLRLVGGCLCFPSHWSLEEKMGRTMEEIHEVVPALNGQIGGSINQFLSHMKPGVAWLRSNWGISASSELNQHTALPHPPVTSLQSADELSFRIEDQALVRLPKTDAVLFGIRLRVLPLSALAAHPEHAAGLHRALSTMSAPMAAYKGIETARQHLLGLLQGTDR